LAVLALSITFVAVYFLRDLIIPVVVSIFLAYLLEPIVDGFENRGLPRVWALILIFLTSAAVISIGVVLLRDQVAEEVRMMLSDVRLDQPQLYIAHVQEKLKAAFPGAISVRIIDALARVASEYVDSFFRPGVESLTGLFSAFGATIIIPFLTFFLLKDSRALKKGIVQYIPNRYFEMSLSLIHKTSRQLGRYIRGVLLDAAIVGIMVMIALSILDLRYAILIGALAGMANLIPYLGPVVAGIPAVAISIYDTGNLSGVPAVLLAFAVVKVIDDALVQPLVVSKSVELHPASVIIAIYVGGHLGGILGMIVAVPLVSIAKESFNILYWGLTNYYIFGSPRYADAGGRAGASSSSQPTPASSPSSAAEQPAVPSGKNE